MCKYIGIEDLVANALIELIERDDECRFVSFVKMMKYGIRIIKILKEKEIEAVLLVSREYKSEMLYNYSDYFEVTNKGTDDEGIQLKVGKEVKDLREHFRSLLTKDLLDVFTSDESIKELLEAI